MKVVILAGGLGTRMSEITKTIPKPMVKILDKPILIHIMEHYYKFGFDEFYIALGYKGNIIRNYFKKNRFDWKVHLIETGKNSMTGGRLKRLKKYLNNEKNFCFTYGDGLSDINIRESIKFHINQKKLVTLSGVQAPGRYGSLDCDGIQVKSFVEKPKGENSYINGGFFVISKKALKYIKGDDTSWEIDTLKIIAKKKELIAYKHKGFWHAMDTLRDKNYLENLWSQKKAPWKLWD